MIVASTLSVIIFISYIFRNLHVFNLHAIKTYELCISKNMFRYAVV